MDMYSLKSIQAGTMFIFALLATTDVVYSYENQYGPGYGKEWIYFVDENGIRHIMNFSNLPTDTRGLMYGDVVFHLYTRNNPSNPEELFLTNNDTFPMKSKYFKQTKDVKVITHGWLSSDQIKWLQKMKESFLTKYDLNVVTVDWSELANNPIYPWSALSTRYIGKRVAKFLNAVKRSFEVNSTNIHLIGHSLGAQVMGYAGMFSNGEISRITGLDPARPLFEIPYMDSDFRLDKTDAEFVDIIHTCAGVYGYRISHGHADFYPNSGKPPQPGCEGVQEKIEACSHGRSYEFFEKSIASENSFNAFLCESWEKYIKGECSRNSAATMGLTASKDAANGDYYLNTKNKK